MKKSVIALALAVFASAASAADVLPRAAWDDPFELKQIRAEMARTRTIPQQAPSVSMEPEGPAQKLLRQKRSELETLYRNSPSGPVPDGKSRGFAAIAPGTPAGGVSQALFSFFWHGKIFDRKNGRLINRLTIGHVVKANVFIGPSWLDGKPSVIIDYKGTSWVAGAIRDEIREVSPGVYLGFAYVRDQNGGEPRADIVFALDFGSDQIPTVPAPSGS